MLTVDRTAFTDVRMVRQLVAGNPQSTVVLAMDRDVLASSVMLLSPKNKKMSDLQARPKVIKNATCPKVKRESDTQVTIPVVKENVRCANFQEFKYQTYTDSDISILSSLARGP